MKKSILSLALAVIMVMALLTVGAFAEEKTVSDVNGLTAALAAADDGDTIVLEAGDYDVGTLRVQKAVNFKGAGIGQTVIIGSINYYCGKPDSVKSITVENLTVKSQANNKTDEQAIWWSYNPSNPLESVSLYVKNCEVVDYLFGIGVNSSTKNCAVYVENLKLDNVWCGANVSEGAGNTVEAYDIAAGSSVDYEIQVFGKSGAENSNTYYKTYEDCVNDPTRANPALNSNDSMPNISNGDWPAAAILNDKYYGTIQAAVDDAEDNAIITVLPGTYNEVVTFDGKSLTLKAQNYAYENGIELNDESKLSKITGKFDTFNSDYACHADQTVIIEGFAFSGSGLKVGNMNQNGVGNLEVRNCTMTFGSNEIKGSGNTYTYLNYFVKVSDDVGEYASVVVEDNYVEGTPAENIIPIQLWHVKSAKVNNNVINLSGDNGLEAVNISILKDKAIVTVQDNNITNANGGIYVTTWKCGEDNTGNTPFEGFVYVNDNKFYCGGTPIFVGFPDGATDDYGAFNGTLNEDNNTNNGVPVAVEVGQKPGSTGYYTVTVMSGNSVVDTATVESGTEYPLPAAPSNSGYIFLGWRSGDNTYKAGEAVTITADTTFVAVWGNLPDVKPSEPSEPETPVFPFYDVSARDWYYSAVKYVYEKGLMDGVDVGVFAPNDTLTRAMVWTIIARAEGVDTTGGATWYAKAQEWVTAKGISDGENPNAAITRQELVTMLYRLAGEPAVSGTITAPDAASVSTWATDAMTWAMNIGLVEGDENGAVTPTATATRAQAAALIMRYLEA